MYMIIYVYLGAIIYTSKLFNIIAIQYRTPAAIIIIIKHNISADINGVIVAQSRYKTMMVVNAICVHFPLTALTYTWIL